MAEADSIAIGRRCTVCGEFKQADQFNKSRRAKDGLTNRCRPCNAAYCAAYMEAGGVRKSHAQRKAEKLSAGDKLCPKCDMRKPKAEFGKSPDRSDGLRPWCKLCHNESNKKWRDANPEAQNRAIRDWEARNPDRVKEKRDRSNARMWSIPSHRLRMRIGAQIRCVLAGTKSRKSTMEIVGYTSEQLRSHIELQFLPGMSWSNMHLWHIDHIVPVSSFSIQGIDDPELKRAWALSNLRPLWATDNRRKKDKRLFLI